MKTKSITLILNHHGRRDALHVAAVPAQAAKISVVTTLTDLADSRAT